MRHLYSDIHFLILFSLSLSLPELNQTQSVLAQSFHARPEWRNGEELMVDVEPWGGKEWQVSTPESHFHGQQQQVHEEPRTSSQEKGQLRGNACSLGADLLCVKIGVVLNLGWTIVENNLIAIFLFIYFLFFLYCDSDIICVFFFFKALHIHH